jgi:hypothetical protein
VSDTKQFIYLTDTGDRTTTPTDLNYYIYSITPDDESVDDSGTSTLSHYDSDGSSWSFFEYNNIEGINTPGGGAGATEAACFAAPNRQNSGIKAIQADLDNRDPRIQLDSVLTADKCRAVVTGQYVPRVRVTHQPYNSQTAHFGTPFQFLYTELGKSGGGDSNFFQSLDQSNFRQQIDASSPLDGDGGATITFTSQGSSVTGGALTGHVGKGFRLDFAAPQTTNNWGKVELRVEPIRNPGGSYEPKIFFKGTVQRSWEANLFTIDGVGSDTIEAITGTATVACSAGLIHKGESTITATASISEESKNIKQASSTFTTTAFTTTCNGNLIFAEAISNILCEFSSTLSYANLVFANANISATVSSTGTANKIHGLVETNLSIAPSFTTTGTGALVYDIAGDYTWDSFNLNTYFEQGFSVDNFSLSEGEYTWDFLASTDWDNWPVETWLGDESGWDSWPENTWDREFELPGEFTTALTPTIKVGSQVVTVSGAFTLDENSAFEKATSANITAPAFTLSCDAGGILEFEADITAAFTPSLVANYKFTLSDTPVSITGAFIPVLTASAITDTLADISVTFAVAEVVPSFKPSGTIDTTVTVSIPEAIPSFIHGATAAISALASTVNVGRLFFQADPFNIITVPSESRTLPVITENRITLIDSENRVNIINTDTRTVLVPEETRRIKLKIPALSSRFTTPRVRSEV